MFTIKDKYGKEHLLQGNTRPSYTGMGLTRKQKMFFKDWKGMQAIAKDLFDGDYWEANAFQSKYLLNGVLQMNDACQFKLIEY